MSGFWEKVLGTPQPEQQPAPVSSDSVPWWQRTAVPEPQQVPARQPQAAPPEAPQSPSAPADHMARTQWAHQSGKCPNPTCGSDNYFAPPGDPNARSRCYDCGYPINQSGSGVTLKGQNAGPVKEARQTEAARTNSFNPHQIFDRLG